MAEAWRLLAGGDGETWFIVLTSIKFSFLSTIFALLLALPCGVALALGRFPGRRALVSVVNALQAVPTVVIGLAIYTLISRSGPLGRLGWLYEGPGVVFGQAVLAFPIVVSLVHAGLSRLDPRCAETLATHGLGPCRRFLATLREARGLLAAAAVTAFGRVTGEVGVSMMLGGNIRGSTRTMTTAIALDTAKGEFERAIGLGIVLLTLALAVNLAVHLLVRHDD
jgi:tungstate transport system permease protein